MCASLRVLSKPGGEVKASDCGVCLLTRRIRPNPVHLVCAGKAGFRWDASSFAELTLLVKAIGAQGNSKLRARRSGTSVSL